jgi:Spy/CpxP family protein refolding chaperone
MFRQRKVWVGGLAIAIAIATVGCASGDEVPATGSTGGELEVAHAEEMGHHDRRGHRGRHAEGDRVEHRLERMREHLELTDAQVEQVRPILSQAGERGRGNRAQVREELAAVLTPDQLAKLDERMERRRGRHGRRGGGRMIARLFHALELTDAQKEQVQPILESARERRRTIRELPREERRAAIEAAHGEVRAQLVPILEPAQLTRFDEISERMRERMERRHERRGERGERRGRRGPRGGPGGAEGATDPGAIDPNGI